MFSIRKLFAQTVWAKDAIPDDEWTTRHLRRIILPIADLLFIAAGILAAVFGIPAMGEFFPDLIIDCAAYSLAALGVVCLVGVSFPKLWRIEVVGKSGIVGLLVGYSTSLLLLTAEGDDRRGFAIAISLVAALVPVTRLLMLSDTRGFEVSRRNRKL